MGFGLYNRISAVEATELEVVMFAVGIVIYLRFMKDRENRKAS